MRFAIIYSLFFLVNGGLFAQASWEAHYKVYDTRAQREITLSELVESTGGVEVVFFGEEHNDSIAHRLQFSLYEGLLQRYGDVVLSMEMFERDAQLVVDEYLDDHITEARLRDEGKGWKNYKDYAPMVNLAKERNQKVVAANVPTRYANLVSRKGLPALDQLPKPSRKFIVSLPLETNRPEYQEKFYGAMGGHGHSMGPGIFHAQLLRDATMAESIFRAWRKNKRTKILHLNGRFHSDGGLGTVEALKDHRKKIQLLTISAFSSDDFEEPNWQEHVELADIVILTDPDVKKSF